MFHQEGGKDMPCNTLAQWSVITIRLQEVSQGYKASKVQQKCSGPCHLQRHSREAQQMNEMETPIQDTSGYENMTSFTHLLKDWMAFGYFESAISVLLPLFLLLGLLLVLYQGILIPLWFFYSSSFYLYFYKKLNNLPEDTNNELWNKPRRVVAQYWDSFGKIWHDYEIVGMEHLPEGPGLIISYHGAITFDYLFLLMRFLLSTERLFYTVAHHIFFLLPGFKTFVDTFPCIVGTRKDCIEILKKGYLLGISPGGLREGNFSDENYEVLWGNRTGFAQLALEAKVPIIPMFTQNIREAYRTFGKIWLLRLVYERFRMLVLPMYGGFPVKLRTYLGEPIPYDPNITAKELAEKTKMAIEHLRDKYQKRPGSIIRALSERFDKNQKNA